MDIVSDTLVGHYAVNYGVIPNSVTIRGSGRKVVTAALLLDHLLHVPQSLHSGSVSTLM
jgi:hypothetical protein